MTLSNPPSPQIEALKKRAYLGKFLVKVDVPAEILQDQEVRFLEFDKVRHIFAQIINLAKVI